MKTYREFIAETQLKLEPFGSSPDIRDIFSRILLLLRSFSTWPKDGDYQQVQQSLEKKHNYLKKIGKVEEAKTVREIAQNLQAGCAPPSPA